MIHGFTQVRVNCFHRPAGCQNWYPIPSSMLTDPRIDGKDWDRLKELRIDVHGDKQRMAGVAHNAAELRDLLEKIVGKKPVDPPYSVAKRIEEEAGPTPGLRRSIHWNEELNKETKDPAEIYGPTAAKPLTPEELQ
jgi:hypothetical protein